MLQLFSLLIYAQGKAKQDKDLINQNKIKVDDEKLENTSYHLRKK